MKKKLYVEDTCTMDKNAQFYHAENWLQLAEITIQLSQEHNDYVRFLPACNDWNLDYPEPGESVEEYKVRLIDMAIDLQLIG